METLLSERGEKALLLMGGNSFDLVLLDKLTNRRVEGKRGTQRKE